MKKIPRTTNQLMRKSQLRQIIRESIREVMNEGLMDSIVKQFDNLDDFTDKIITKHPDFVEKTFEKLKETGGNVVDILKPAADEGFSYLKEKNTSENQEKIKSWVQMNYAKFMKVAAVAWVYSLIESIVPDMILNIGGVIPELLILGVALYAVYKIGTVYKSLKKGGKELMGMKENTEEIDFDLPLDLTGLVNFVTPEQQN